MTTERFRTEDLVLGYGGRTIVDGVSLSVRAGRVTVIIGANASGKSTLLRGLSRLLTPRGGRVLLDGRDLATWKPAELARTVALLPQSPTAPDGITVGDLVGRGRHPHQRWFRRWSAEDDAAVDDALAATGTSALVARQVSELSGGQRQRVWIAMALAQRTEVLLLDEPTTFLDLRYQVEVLDLLHELNRTRGTTVVLVLHDLQLAARYADDLVAMRDGRVVAQGAPVDVLDAAVVEQVFSLPSRIIEDPVSGAPLVLPVGRYRVLDG
jgi:iron complex transport system ATP-binding protein